MEKCQEKEISEEIEANVNKEFNIRHLYTQLV